MTRLVARAGQLVVSLGRPGRTIRAALGMLGCRRHVANSVGLASRSLPADRHHGTAWILRWAARKRGWPRLGMKHV